jgi:hypothetical protein
VIEQAAKGISAVAAQTVAGRFSLRAEMGTERPVHQAGGVHQLPHFYLLRFPFAEEAGILFHSPLVSHGPLLRGIAHCFSASSIWDRHPIPEVARMRKNIRSKFNGIRRMHRQYQGLIEFASVRVMFFTTRGME